MAPSSKSAPLELITRRVVDAVAAHSNTGVTELPPLYDVIDPDALESLIASMPDGKVSFTYAGCGVTVESNGAIDVSVTPPDG